MSRATNYCDHGHETQEEVRYLPLGGGARIITCRRHWESELRFRKETGKARGSEDLPSWGSLEIESSAVGEER